MPQTRLPSSTPLLAGRPSRRGRRAAGATFAFVAVAVALFAADTTPVRAQEGDAAATDAVPTEVTVRVLARGAKLIGTSVGGARVVIRDAATGTVLAEGDHLGGTGDTDRIMRQLQVRGETTFATEGAAEFRATLLLSEPTRVEVEAVGPLDYPQAQVRTLKVLDLVPGVHIGPEGVVLELNGLIVEVERAGEWVTSGAVEAAGAGLPVRARVRMLCSCPIEPGGLWEIDVVEAVIRDAQGEIRERTPLDYAGETSTFAGELALPEGDRTGWTLEVIATDPPTGNVGRLVLPLR